MPGEKEILPLRQANKHAGDGGAGSDDMSCARNGHYWFKVSLNIPYVFQNNLNNIFTQ
jgi:hypothetical protein